MTQYASSHASSVPARIHKKKGTLLLSHGIVSDGFNTSGSSSSPQPLSWSLPKLDRVTMRIISESSFYQAGSQAWDNLLPEGGHIVHIKNSDDMITTYTVAMFHQLRCLKILHSAYMDEGSHRTSTLTKHCINYLRQTLMCHMDMRTELQASVATSNGFDAMCYDWEPIFEAAEQNYISYTTSDVYLPISL